MKIAIYQDGKLTAVYTDINNPKIRGDELFFDNGGYFGGINDNHFLIEDGIEPTADLTPVMLQLDKKNTVDKYKTVEEQQAERIEVLENALLAILDLI